MTEAQIRKALIDRLIASSSGGETAFISELFVDSFSRRADLVMANGKLSVFEIKSERDNLDRLKGQISSYKNFFEEVTVVCAPRHQVNVQAIVSDNIGVWLVGNNGHLSVLRKAKSAPLPSIENWLSFLPVDELKKLLRNNELRASGNRTVLVEAASLLAVKSVRAYVLGFLKRRDKKIRELRSRKVVIHPPTHADRISSNSNQLQEFIKSLSCSASALPRRITHQSSPSSSSPT